MKGRAMHVGSNLVNGLWTDLQPIQFYTVWNRALTYDKTWTTQEMPNTAMPEVASQAKRAAMGCLWSSICMKSFKHKPSEKSQNRTSCSALVVQAWLQTSMTWFWSLKDCDKHWKRWTFKLGFFLLHLSLATQSHIWEIARQLGYLNCWACSSLHLDLLEVVRTTYSEKSGFGFPHETLRRLNIV